MYSIAMVIDGYVYGVLLVENGQVKRAWLDPIIVPGTICEKLEFRSDDPAEVMASVKQVLDVRYIPEVDPNIYDFNLDGSWSPSFN